MAEVDYNVNPKEAVFYNPDSITPDTHKIIFPKTADVPEGFRLKVINSKDSASEVIFSAQGSDLIANPLEAHLFAAGWRVSIGQLVTSYMRVGSNWHLDNHSVVGFINDAIENFAFAAYGGLRLSTATAGDNIEATWDTVDQFDQLIFSTPKEIVQSLTNNSLAFSLPGVYNLSITLSISHNEDTGGRETGLRLYNITDSVAGPTTIIPIGRNQPGTLIGISTPFEILAADVGKEYVVQVGGFDSLTSVIYNSASYSANGIGNLLVPPASVNPYP